MDDLKKEGDLNQINWDTLEEDFLLWLAQTRDEERFH